MSFPFRVIDLTHVLSLGMPSWNGSCGFEHQVKLDYQDCDTEVKFRVQKIAMHAGIGTHLDAPSHCIPGGCSVSELKLENLIAPCVVIDISHKLHERAELLPADIENFESNYQKIAAHSFVIVRTGWDQFWGEPKKYRNELVFPAVSKAAAELLLARDIVGLGIDTLSPDRPENGFPVHAALLGAGKYIVENVANANQLPAVGSYSLVLPIKIAEGTEAPIRMVGLLSTA